MTQIIKHMKLFAFSLVVAVLCLIGCQPAPAPANFSNRPPNPAVSFINQMKQKYNGDASKLTSEERAQMDSITRGHTELAMKSPGK
jgi:hypothetical protein